ncbi:MAG: molybdenum cofactor guanylyltransferase [Candidatus Bathyarchaeia archaeon]
MMRSAIILAGGQSRRFQNGSGRWVDKALAELFGKPLLVHIVENVKLVVDEIIICVNNAARGSHYLRVLENYSITDVKTCVDAKFPHVQGPFAAIATGLKKSGANHCVILPCDAPLIRPSVIDYLLKLVEHLDICVPIHPDGNIEALFFSCNRVRTAGIAELLCLLGRSKPVDIIRASSRIKFVSTINELKNLDPDFRSFININFRSDLVNLPVRFSKEGPVTKSIDLNLIQPLSPEISSLEKIAKKYADGEYLNTIDGISETLSIFEKRGIHFWAGVLWETKGRIFHALALNEEKTGRIKEYYVNSKVAFERAARKYAAESEIYKSWQIKFLFENARGDEIWCLNMREEIAALLSGE